MYVLSSHKNKSKFLNSNIKIEGLSVFRAYAYQKSICRCRRVGQRLSIVKSSSQNSGFQTNSSTGSDKRTDEEYDWQGTYEKPNILDEDMKKIL